MKNTHFLYALMLLVMNNIWANFELEHQIHQAELEKLKDQSFKELNELSQKEKNDDQLKLQDPEIEEKFSSRLNQLYFAEDKKSKVQIKVKTRQAQAEQESENLKNRSIRRR